VEHGEVFTRRWIVDLILDLVGYDAERDLAGLVAVEPACGTGAFLGPMVARLSASCRRHGRSLSDASGAIRAYDLLTRNVEASRRLVEKVLIDDSWPTEEAVAAAETWVRKATTSSPDGVRTASMWLWATRPTSGWRTYPPIAWPPTGRPARR
jgi:hypothetical protein